MSLYGAVVDEGLYNLVLSKKHMLLNLQNNSRKLSAIMRRELFRSVSNNTGYQNTNLICETQIACCKAHQLIEKFRTELEHANVVKSAHERFSLSVNRSNDYQEVMLPSKCLSVHLLNGPVSDQLLELVP